MLSHTEEQLIRSLMTPTRYCWPVTEFESLRQSAMTLRSRPAIESDEHARDATALPVDKHLHSLTSGMPVSVTSRDEEGKFLMFVHLLTPLSRERSRTLSHLDDAANEKPLLVSILYPDLAFDLSELEAAYDFSVATALEEHFGPAVEQHLIAYHEMIYIDAAAAFFILSHQHPALLTALGFSLVLRNERYPTQIREILRGASEAMRAVENRVTDRVFEEVTIEAPREIYQVCCNLLSDTEAAIAGLLVGDNEEGDTDSWFLRHTMNEAFASLLLDEKLAFDSVIARSIPRFAEETGMEVDYDDTQDLGPEPDIIIETLNRTCRLVRRVRHRLFMLRQSMPVTEE